jgi:hypothetical protein
MPGRRGTWWSPRKRSTRRFDKLPRHFPLDSIHSRARSAPVPRKLPVASALAAAVQIEGKGERGSPEIADRHEAART